MDTKSGSLINFVGIKGVYKIQDSCQTENIKTETDFETPGDID